eukprot:TRINITY_DN4765_c0_g2_i2.p1 TRINITY_DN4765_c0_g2~~TRINITY_DN4765_c0_g2_i2.p1  ORF type:complete len:187 (-),score=57.86 TRINITY_DN4765_c0_g2_i2:449-1009(-)
MEEGKKEDLTNKSITNTSGRPLLSSINVAPNRLSKLRNPDLTLGGKPKPKFMPKIPTQTFVPPQRKEDKKEGEEESSSTESFKDRKNRIQPITKSWEAQRRANQAASLFPVSKTTHGDSVFSSGPPATAVEEAKFSYDNDVINFDFDGDDNEVNAKPKVESIEPLNIINFDDRNWAFLILSILLIQ